MVTCYIHHISFLLFLYYDSTIYNDLIFPTKSWTNGLKSSSKEIHTFLLEILYVLKVMLFLILPSSIHEYCDKQNGNIFLPNMTSIF